MSGTSNPIICDLCDQVFDPRPKNPASDVCEECLEGAVFVVVQELKAQGITVPACLEPSA